MSIPSENNDSEAVGIKYRVNTEITKDDLIVQELHNGSQLLSRWILDAQDRQIKTALVALGWTPPPPVPNPAIDSHASLSPVSTERS